MPALDVGQPLLELLGLLGLLVEDGLGGWTVLQRPPNRP